MNRIEKGLHEHHASMQAAEATKEEASTSTSLPVVRPQSEAIIETPFAKVNSVESGSPAHEASLKAGDKIRSFGSANWTNHENLRKLGEVVQRNEGVRHPVTSSMDWFTNKPSVPYLLRCYEKARSFSFD